MRKMIAAISISIATIAGMTPTAGASTHANNVTPSKAWPNPVKVTFKNGCTGTIHMSRYYTTIYNNYGGWERKGAKTAIFESRCGDIGVPFYHGKWGKPVLMD